MEVLVQNKGDSYEKNKKKGVGKTPTPAKKILIHGKYILALNYY